jgi:hypothetical protein
MKVLIHCSDSSWGNASEITKWHTLPSPNGNGWKSIGYHYIILNGLLSLKCFNEFFDGSIETGVPLDGDNILSVSEFGAHAISQNDKSVGICLIGKTGDFTPKQKESLKKLLTQLKIQFGNIEIFQHSDFEPKKPFCAGLGTEYIEYLRKTI